MFETLVEILAVWDPTVEFSELILEVWEVIVPSAEVTLVSREDTADPFAMMSPSAAVRSD
jgi:hypothetical protein